MQEIQIQDHGALQALAVADAQHLVAKYQNLTLWPLLARLLISMYHTRPAAEGPEDRDGDPISEEQLETFRQLYVQFYEATMAMIRTVHPPRRALVRVIASNNLWQMRQVFGLLQSIPACPPLSTARPQHLVELLKIVDTLARYLLLNLDEIPDLIQQGAKDSYRPFIDEVLRFTGWSFSQEEVTAACLAATIAHQGEAASSAGLRLTRTERATLKAWREGHGFV